MSFFSFRLRRPGQSRLLVAVAVAAAVTASVPALAGGLRVSPLKLDISARRPIAQLELSNLESRPITAQIEVSAWTVENGQDVLTPTTDIQFVPPIVSVPPGGHRTVRVRLRATADLSGERAYRLYIQEISAVTSLDETDLNELASGTQFHIRFGIPLFVQPIRRAPAAIAVSAERQDGRVQVRLENSGPVHLRISGVTAYPAGTTPEQVLPPALASAAQPANTSLYVMAGQTLTWTFPPGQVPAGSAVLVQTDAYSSLGNGALLPSGRVWTTAP